MALYVFFSSRSTCRLCHDEPNRWIIVAQEFHEHLHESTIFFIFIWVFSFVYIVCCWLISLNHFNFCIFNSKFVNANRYSFCSVLYFYYVFDFIVAILLLSLILWREHHSFPHKRRTNKHFITERRLNINNSFMANNNFVFKKEKRKPNELCIGHVVGRSY